jgi:dihydrofolate reductase
LSLDTEFFESIGTVVQGRKTYEQVLSFGDYPYSAKENFVFSKTLKTAEHAEIVTQPVAEFSEEQKVRPGKDIWLVGGGELAAEFFRARVIDTLIVFVQPVLLGDGLTLAGHLGEDVKLELEGTKAFAQGLVRLDYHVPGR